MEAICVQIRDPKSFIEDASMAIPTLHTVTTPAAAESVMAAILIIKTRESHPSFQHQRSGLHEVLIMMR